jgi:hypothetical protein
LGGREGESEALDSVGRQGRRCGDSEDVLGAGKEGWYAGREVICREGA